MTTPRRRRSRSTARPIPAEVAVRRPDPAVWRHALSLADGDVRRLSVAEDGTVQVRNSPDRR